MHWLQSMLFGSSPAVVEKSICRVPSGPVCVTPIGYWGNDTAADVPLGPITMPRTGSHFSLKAADTAGVRITLDLLTCAVIFEVQSLIQVLSLHALEPGQPPCASTNWATTHQHTGQAGSVS